LAAKDSDPVVRMKNKGPTSNEKGKAHREDYGVVGNQRKGFETRGKRRSRNGKVNAI